MLVQEMYTRLKMQPAKSGVLPKYYSAGAKFIRPRRVYVIVLPLSFAFYDIPMEAHQTYF